MIKIAIAGKSKSGKDTAAHIIKDLMDAKSYRVRIDSFADPIKKMCKLMFPQIPDVHLYGPSELRESLIFPAEQFEFEPTLLGCDVCGFGSVENINEWSPYKPCRDCGTVAIPNPQFLTVRQVLLDIGKLGRKYDPDVWSKSCLSNDADLIDTSKSIRIISDLRFKNEMHLAKEAGFVILRLKRPGLPYVSTDVSEIDLDDVHDARFDFVVENDGDVVDLKGKLTIVMDELTARK